VITGIAYCLFILKKVLIFPSIFYFSDIEFSRSGRASSIGTILLGSIAYTWVKHHESQPSKRETSERVIEDVELGEKERHHE